MNQPLKLLDGVKILSFTQYLLGPAAVQYLSDMGADVIKIETPGCGAHERQWAGGNTFLNHVSAFFMLSHRNVRSLTLNLKAPEGKEIARDLIRNADVLVENFRPGVMERFELGYEQVREINPQIIYALASGYGADSASRDLPGQDLLIQALSGLASITGQAGQRPIPAGSAIVDQHGAALLAMGILGALFHRAQTGEGQRVEVTMMQAGFDLQLEPIVYYLNGGLVKRPCQPLASAFHQAPYGLYETADGYLALSSSPLPVLSEALGHPTDLEPYLQPDQIWKSRDEICKVVASHLRCKRTDDWVEILRPFGVWCAPVNDYSRMFSDPMVQELDPILEIDHPQAGPVKLLKHPVRYSSGEPDVRRLPPSLGEHTSEILATLGYDAGGIDRLRAQGIV